MSNVLLRNPSERCFAKMRKKDRECECEEHCGSSEENKKENKKENNKENNKEIPGLYSLIKLQSPGVFF